MGKWENFLKKCRKIEKNMIQFKNKNLDRGAKLCGKQ